MLHVTEQQLEGVLSGLELQRHFRLATTEMMMVSIRRDRLIQRRQFRHINKQMMMPGVLAVGTGRRHAHA